MSSTSSLMKNKPPKVRKSKKPAAAKSVNSSDLFPGVEGLYEVPLSLLCEMAWRVANADADFARLSSSASSDHALRDEDLQKFKSKWHGAIRIAHEMICVAEEGGKDRTSSAQMRLQDSLLGRGVLWHLRRDLPFTSAERQKERVSFSRGCQLISGLKDAKWAQQRFCRMFSHISEQAKNESDSQRWGVSIRPVDEYKAKGFHTEDVILFARSFKRLSKAVLRKPYERSGRFRKNKQGRKKTSKK